MHPDVTRELIPHPAVAAPPGLRITVSVRARDDGAVALCYRLRAPAGLLRLPAAAAPGPADGLWQHTCCEAFVATAGQRGYTEFNFSPSGQWAVYAFDDYRVPACQGNPAWRPAPAIGHDGDDLVVSATLAAAMLPPQPRHLALSCVIEDAAGHLSYWALRHPLARPDFHHRDGFALMQRKESLA
jgi:hypothetical protein